MCTIPNGSFVHFSTATRMIVFKSSFGRHRYWSEFKMSKVSPGKPSANFPVLLRLRTYVPHWEAGPRQVRVWLEQHAKRKYPRHTLKDLPPIEVFEQELSRHELRALYASSDAFVLPTKVCITTAATLPSRHVLILTTRTRIFNRGRAGGYLLWRPCPWSSQ